MEDVPRNLAHKSDVTQQKERFSSFSFSLSHLQGRIAKDLAFYFISQSQAELLRRRPACAMEEGFPLHVAFSGVVFSFLSLIFYLLDVALDLWAIDCLLKEKKYLSMGLLVLLLLGSSVLMQMFSWLWYSEPKKTGLETKVERFISRCGLLGPVHICQLGVFLRFAALMEISICRLKQRNLFPKRVTVYKNHELSMLRLFEAFSENAPQLVLMTPLIMEMQEVQSFTVIKIISLSFTMLSYHHNMRAILPEKLKMGWSSPVIYFLWNLFLIGPRVMSVSLFTTVFPCYVAAHFLSLWTLLVIWAWWQKTDFMDSRAGEWLYRTTVGLIWYFSWFNVASGSTKLKGMIYHVVIGVDTMLLLGLWWWWRSVESARLNPLPINPFLLVAVLVIIYITGILLKLVYYWKCHPNKADLQMDERGLKSEPDAECNDTEPSTESQPEPLVLSPTQDTASGVHKRIKNMAESFYG